MSPVNSGGKAGAPYRIGFAMTQALGNQTVSANIEKYARRDPEVEVLWASIRHWVDPDPYPWLWGPVHRQAVLNAESRDLRGEWRSLDAVVVHAFQLFAYLATFKRLGRHPQLVICQDYAPTADPQLRCTFGKGPIGGVGARARLYVERWYTGRADLLMPRAEWVAKVLLEECGIAPSRVVVAAHGVDLELWTPRTSPRLPGRPRLIFVGSDFLRKGGDLLIDVYRRALQDLAELHVVTADPPADLPRGVTCHPPMLANSPELRAFFQTGDVFVFPTRADTLPLVLMEAMACGIPVVATSVGGVPEIVDHRRTGFVIPRDDRRSLAEAILTLVHNPVLARGMGAAGRARVEQRYSAERNTNALLRAVKRAVDCRRSREEGK